MMRGYRHWDNLQNDKCQLIISGLIRNCVITIVVNILRFFIIKLRASPICRWRSGYKISLARGYLLLTIVGCPIRNYREECYIGRIVSSQQLSVFSKTRILLGVWPFFTGTHVVVDIHPGVSRQSWVYACQLHSPRCQSFIILVLEQPEYSCLRAASEKLEPWQSAQALIRL